MQNLCILLMHVCMLYIHAYTLCICILHMGYICHNYSLQITVYIYIIVSCNYICIIHNCNYS